MTTARKSTTELLALYAQIEEICAHFKQIRSEAAGIVEHSQMPDAALHLNDVLQATEEAATVILDAASKTDEMVANSSLDALLKQDIADQLGRIYMASSFQDISGQRIKKVLQHLTTLETQLLRLSDIARGEAVEAAKPADPFLHGPALAAAAPTQADIDAMFSQS